MLDLRAFHTPNVLSTLRACFSPPPFYNKQVRQLEDVERRGKGARSHGGVAKNFTAKVKHMTHTDEEGEDVQEA